MLFIFISISLLSNVYGFALPFEGVFKLDIIHYNDFHARFEETSVATSTCRFNNNSCLGGFPRLYHQIHELMVKKPDSILLNAGDSFQGTYWYTLLKWNITQKFMNLLPHDAHAIGNHEFDDGPKNLAHYLAALKAPVLVANMDTSKEPSLRGLYKPSIIIKRHGRRIGIIGLITVDTEKLSSPENVVFTDPREATRREVKKLTDQGVDIIILLSHCGLDIDKELARDYGEHIDIIVGGHTHSLLWNGPSPSGEAVAGPYPVFIQTTADAKHKVMIVQASAFTKYMGRVTLDFDIHGKMLKWDGAPIFLNRSIPEDENIKKLLEPYAKMVHDAENVEIGESKTTLSFEDCVYGECALGDMLVDSMVEYAKEKVNANIEYISFIQRGNIKSTILQGSITKGILFELLPYDDKLKYFQLQGKYIVEALERSVIDAWDYKPFKGPWLLQVAGLHVTYNVSLPEGSRITSLHVGDVTSNTPLENDAYYNVVAPNYLADGGDGFSMFKDNQKSVSVFGRDQDAVETYLKKHSPVNIKTNNRIVINS